MKSWALMDINHKSGTKAEENVGLVLSGGGARGAYQAGVVKAVSEITGRAGIKNPISYLTGVSAGAVNTAFLAANCSNFVEAAESLSRMWAHLTADKVFRTDLMTAGWLGAKFFSDATLGALYRKKLARSLLDTSPLYDYLKEKISFDRIESHLRNGHFKALAVTAMNYSTSISTTFVQGQPHLPMWARTRRKSERAKINIDHVMASAAIPIFFPPTRVGEDHFGDGCLRNTAPLSPAIHLGAQRLLVISVREQESRTELEREDMGPSMARVLGVMMSALLLDAIDVDMERLERINQTVAYVSVDKHKDFELRPITQLWIRPSENIGELAYELSGHLPKVIRYLLRGLGTSKEASQLTSYLLFDPAFTVRLSELGYRDGIAKKEEILELFRPTTA